MFHFSTVATLAKNQLSSDAPFLTLIDVDCKELDEHIRLVRNTEDITWNGYIWTAYPIDIEEYTEDGKTLPALKLKISSGGGLVTSYLQQYDGFVDSEVAVYIVNAEMLATAEPEMELDFVINETAYDEQWISFTLGPSPEIADRFPAWRYLNDFCPFVCGDIRCGYVGEESCNNNLVSCLMPERFGGEPGIQSGR